MSQSYLHTYQHVLRTASESIEDAIRKADINLDKIVDLLAGLKGKVIVSGIGKSSIIAQKIAATFSSTGTNAVFLHAGEAFHGDLGICNPGDVAIVISKSGTTSELVKLVPYFKENNINVIGILGNINSPLSNNCDFVLDASVKKEADDHNIVPTASTTLAITIGDALAVCLMQKKGFTAIDFAKYHPGGQLGKNLTHKVKDHMIKLNDTPTASDESSLKDIIVGMTEKPVGAACLIDVNEALVGIITDGDIRRYLVKHDDIKNVKAGELMTRKPVHISPEDSIINAIKLMEERSSKISVLPVVENNKLVGIIRIHDVY